MRKVTKCWKTSSFKTRRKFAEIESDRRPDAWNFAQASLGHYIEWIVVLSLETFPQLECSNMSVGSPPLTPPCRCPLGLANRHHAIIHKSAHLYLMIQSAKIFDTLYLHVQPPPSWYPLGFAWWSASNGCGLIYVLSTSQPINTPGSECIYFCTNFANPKQIWEKYLEADHSSVLFQILHQEISRSQYEHLNICNRFQTTRMMGQTWWPNFQIAQLLTFCIPWNSTLR